MLNASWSTSASTSWSWSTSKSWLLLFVWSLLSADESAVFWLLFTDTLDPDCAAEKASPPIAFPPSPSLEPPSDQLCLPSFLSQSPQPSSPPLPPRPPSALPPTAAEVAVDVEVAVLVCVAVAGPVTIALVCSLGAVIVELCSPLAVAVPS